MNCNKSEEGEEVDDNDDVDKNVAAVDELVLDLELADAAESSGARVTTSGVNSKASSVEEDDVSERLSFSDDSSSLFARTAHNSSSTPSTSTQAYGGARPKTRALVLGERVRLRQERTRNSETKVNNCDSGDNNVLVESSSTTHLPNMVELNSLPRLETKSSVVLTSTTSANPGKRNSFPDIVSDETEAQTEDDCYIYTYKGGTAYLSADLPNSFFRLDSGSDGESLPGVAGAGQSNLSTGVAALIQDQLINGPIRSFSPDQDFIEMDFDPGFESDDSDSSGDSGQGRDGTDMEDLQEVEVRDEGSLSPDPLDLQPPTPLILLPNNNNVSKTADDASCRDCGADGGMVELAVVIPLLTPPPPPTSPPPSPPSALDLEDPPNSPLESPKHQTPHPSSAPVLSPAEEAPVILIPRSRSLNSSLGTQPDCPILCSGDPPVRIANLSLCGSRLLQREALIFKAEGGEPPDPLLGDMKEGPDPASTLFRLTCVESSLSHKAMIWTEKEAIRKQVTQIGTSACGATALINVALALELEQDVLLPLAESVFTRLRRPDSDLPDYLLSRSEAGCNHLDLVRAVHTALPGRIVTRFFPLHRRALQLSAWLASWISAGCVPILTLNLQKAAVRPGTEVADAWHHQMAWGVSGHDVYLTNPLEMVPESLLLPQICSPSELLVRKADIVTRFCPTTDLGEINRLGGEEGCARWQELNVLGQVANVIREERRFSLREDESVSLTSHVKIPACYTSGVTLFCLAENKAGAVKLKSAPDLPFIN